MKSANIADLKAHFSEFLASVESGEEVEIRKRNVPVARIVPHKVCKGNQTKLGCLAGTVQINCDLTEPAFDESDWEMLRS